MIGNNALGIGLGLIMGGIAVFGVVYFGIAWLWDVSRDQLQRRKKE